MAVLFLPFSTATSCSADGGGLMFCPQCRTEYRVGFTHCSDCHVALVERLTEAASPSSSVGDRNGLKDGVRRSLLPLKIHTIGGFIVCGAVFFGLGPLSSFFRFLIAAVAGLIAVVLYSRNVPTRCPRCSAWAAYQHPNIFGETTIEYMCRACGYRHDTGWRYDLPDTD